MFYKDEDGTILVSEAVTEDNGTFELAHLYEYHTGKHVKCIESELIHEEYEKVDIVYCARFNSLINEIVIDLIPCESDRTLNVNLINEYRDLDKDKAIHKLVTDMKLRIESLKNRADTIDKCISKYYER